MRLRSAISCVGGSGRARRNLWDARRGLRAVFSLVLGPVTTPSPASGSGNTSPRRIEQTVWRHVTGGRGFLRWKNAAKTMNLEVFLARLIKKGIPIVS
jgi:hypothetical protein